jgi:hypothetical protein
MHRELFVRVGAPRYQQSIINVLPVMHRALFVSISCVHAIQYVAIHLTAYMF